MKYQGGEWVVTYDFQERRFGGHGVCVLPIYCFFVPTVKRQQSSDAKELMPGISFNLAWSTRENAGSEGL
jgi:hypothetical protein